MFVIHTTPRPVKVLVKDDGINQEGFARPDDRIHFSARERSYCRWEDELTYLRLEFNPNSVNQAAVHSDILTSSNAIELNHKLRLNDPKLFHLSLWLLDELQSEGAGGQLYIHLANRLTVHLSHNYASAPGNKTPSPSKRTEQPVARVIAYMHANLECEISLVKLAAIANISQSHLSRLFKQRTGLSPHQYFINLRIDKAKSLILSRRFTMAEISAMLGFTDQSHMSRHFKRITGISPRVFLNGR